MPADRRAALWTRLLHMEKTPAVRVTWYGVDFDDFARQAARDVNRSAGAVGYSVPVLAQAADQKLFNHAPPR
jgi:hypothetical protein